VLKHLHCIWGKIFVALGGYLHSALFDSPTQALICDLKNIFRYYDYYENVFTVVGARSSVDG
jgi:hypothetical protein